MNASLISLLQCPRCLQGSLQFNASVVTCSNHNCPAFVEAFPMVSGQPVLIDFSRGVFEKSNYKEESKGAVIQRRSGPGTLLKRLLWGSSPESSRQVNRLIGKLPSARSSSTVLIIGGGTRGLGTENLYDNPAVELVAFDVYASANTNFVADGHNIPLADASVDAVVIQAVLEHVLEPQKVVAEIHRVLKPQGLVYAETPFMQQVHEAAYDFTRFTESGHRWLFKQFHLIDSGPIAGLGTSLVWSIRYFFAGLFRSRAIGTLAAAFFFWLRFLEKLIPAKDNIAGGSCFYFLGIKAEQPIHEKEVIAFYDREAVNPGSMA